MNQDKILLVAMPLVDGNHTVRVLSLVQSNIVRANNIWRDFLAVLRNAINGEVAQYSRLLSKS